MPTRESSVTGGRFAVRGLRCVLLCFAAVGVSMATTDAIAKAAVVRCGEPVVADAVLKRDLKCSENGPILTTGGVTLDLNGHTIRGSGGGTGILVRPCDETGELVVKDGSVSGFGMGINIAADYGCDHTVTTTVTRLLIADNQTGVLGGIDGGRHGATWLRDNTIRDNTGNGILATHIRPFHVIGNQITRNGGDGVYAFEDSVDRLEDNMISHNGGDGAEFQDSVAHVVDNRFMHNAGAGMILFERLCGFRSLYDITGNTALHNGGGGLSAAFSDCDDPLVPPPGDGNVAKRNETFQCILIRCMPGGNSGPDGAGGAREPVGRWLSITSH